VPAVGARSCIIFELTTEARPVQRILGEGRRSDIQGLRAVAVLLVVAFHAGLPVPGGFVGVDVFFVISGFVITGMIERERSSTGRFRFGRFYLRRFKRLTPALALMVAVTMVLSFCLLSPFGSQQTAALTGLGAMVLAANFVISKHTGDYFDQPAESNPLLHTWSLSVEEQFYLIFPAILVLGWVLSQRGRPIKWVPVLVGAVAAISLCEAMVGSSAPGLLAPWPKYLAGFYGPLGRAWEFAAGALLSLVATSRFLREARSARLLAWPGVALLAGSAWVIDKNTPFPSPWTLLPVAGTMLVIAAGTHHATWVNRALAFPPMVKIGDWSYSIYLWHWPLMVFAVVLWPEALPPPSLPTGSDLSYARILAGVLSFLPAVASYRWVEQPIRRLPPLTRRRTFALVGAVVSPAILLAATADVAADRYWLPRYKWGALLVHQGDTEWDDFFPLLQRTYYPCTDKAVLDGIPKQDFPRCRQSKPDSQRNVALVGDSHSEHLFLGLAEALPNKNIVYYALDQRPLKSRNGMDRIIDHVASDPTVETVIVNALWDDGDVVWDELVTTLETFRSAGKTVVVTDDVPWFPFDAVACKYRIVPILPRVECSTDRKLFDEAYAGYYPELKAAIDKVPGVQLLNTARYFCDAEVCSMNKGAALLYRDANHLNNVGSRFLANRMLTDFPQFRAAVTQR
jgi:peptidoglycan/LPS O-acetylase OafA/YrhL